MKRDFANPYPSGKATTKARRKPNKLSWIVTSALLRNNPELKPLLKLAKTSPGAGRTRLFTCPKAVLTYQPINKNRPSVRGGIIDSIRCATANTFARAGLPSDTDISVSLRAYLRIPIDTPFSVEVVTLIYFPQS